MIYFENYFSVLNRVVCMYSNFEQVFVVFNVI